MAISSPGVGSGLDVQSIVRQLVAAESGPTTSRLNRMEAVYQAEISAFGALKSAVANFKSSISGLTESANFQLRNASSTKSSIVTVSADETAATGAYQVEVNRLAQAHKYASQSYLSTDTIGGNIGDTLDVTIGTASLSIDLSTAKTLEDIQTEIATAAETNNVDVSAAIVNGNGGSQTLVLTSGTEGFDNRVQIGGTIGGVATATAMGFSHLNKLSDGSIITSEAELDAEMIVDGVTVTRSGNSINDVISGVTFSLESAEPGTLVDINITLNTSSVENNIKKLVTSYNQLAAVINDLTQVNDDNTRGILVGDATLRNMALGIRNQLSGEVSGVTGDYSNLASLGITTTRQGTLEIDDAKLSEAVTNGFDGMALLFAGDNGIATRLDTYLDNFSKGGGLLDQKVEGLNNSVEQISEERTALDFRMEKLEARYLKQFSGLDTLMSSMQLTSSFLSQQLALIPKYTIKSN